MSYPMLGFAALWGLASCGPTGGSDAPASDAASPGTVPSGTSADSGSTAPTKAVDFAYTTLPAPADPLRVVMLGGTSKNDVWAIARDKDATAGNLDPWLVLHFDGTSWSSGRATLRMTSFALGTAAVDSTMFAAIGGTMLPLRDPSTEIPISIPHRLLGISAVGKRIVVRGQQSESDTSGVSPLFAFDGKTFEPLYVPPTPRGQSVESVWGVGIDDRWVARGMAQSNMTGGLYLPIPLIHVTGTKHEVFSDVHAIKVTGSTNEDVWAATTTFMGSPPVYEIRHFDGITWSVAYISTGSVSDLVELSKDEVFFAYGADTWGTSDDPYDAEGSLYGDMPNIHRYDGTTFVLDTRPGAPRRVGPIGRVGENELWFVHETTEGATRTLRIARLAPAGT